MKYYFLLLMIAIATPGFAQSKCKGNPKVVDACYSVHGRLSQGADSVALWLWPGWHYRFRFLAAAYVVLMFSFGAMFLVPQLWVLVLSQILLGPALGLIYYSSLFYAMDVGDTKGEHGGIHEAVIGVGNCVGPAVAAAALRFFPGRPGSGAWAVCLLLAPGLVVLYWMRYRETRPSI